MDVNFLTIKQFISASSLSILGCIIYLGLKVFRDEKQIFFPQYINVILMFIISIMISCMFHIFVNGYELSYFCIGSGYVMIGILCSFILDINTIFSYLKHLLCIICFLFIYLK